MSVRKKIAGPKTERKGRDKKTRREGGKSVTNLTT